MRCDEYQQKQYSEVFDKEAKRYHIFNSSKIKKAVGFFEPHKCGKILDIGCGDGVFSKTIEEQTGAKIFGLDISESCVKSATTRGINARCMNIDGADIPVDGYSLDVTGSDNKQITHTNASWINNLAASGTVTFGLNLDLGTGSQDWTAQTTRINITGAVNS